MIVELDRNKNELSARKSRRRTAILEATEKLCLENGMGNVSVQDIINECNISRVTFYRYFPDIHPLRMEIASRQMRKMYKHIIETLGWDVKAPTMDPTQFTLEFYTGMADCFYSIRPIFRYLGMFDHTYSKAYPSDELANFYSTVLKRELQSASTFMPLLDERIKTKESSDLFFAIGNITITTMEKLSARGNLLEREQGVTIDYQIDTFKKMLRSLG